MTGPRRLPGDGGRCFAELPALVERALGDHDRVALVYLDAFGWRFLERQGEHPLLRRASVERWTSQFPSTTTAHITTIATGLPVAEHGLYEWYVYEPRLDRLITPLPFSYAGDRERDTLLAAGLRPQDLYPAETLAARLGVPCHSAQPAPLASTPVTRWLLRDSTVHAFETLEGGLLALAEALAAEERAYGNVYLPHVDSLMHEHGPDDPRVDALFAVSQRVGGGQQFVDIAKVVEDVIPAIVGKELKLNVSAAIPAVLLGVGFPVGALKGVPILARTASLIAHLNEEMQDPIGFALSYQAMREFEYTGPAPGGKKQGAA